MCKNYTDGGETGTSLRVRYRSHHCLSRFLLRAGPRLYLTVVAGSGLHVHLAPAAETLSCSRT